MNILLTNDDGINADGINFAYKALKKHFNVTVIAPDSEKSAISHAITLSKPLCATKVTLKDKFKGYAVNGTPADCIKLGLKQLLKQKPDLIISGINLGPNDGCSCFYSGTVAGAREGALCNIPSIAISLATFINPTFESAANIAVKFAKLAIKHKMPSSTFLNINVPNIKKPKGILFTNQSTTPIHTKFKIIASPSNQEFYWMNGSSPKNKSNLNNDTDALNNRYVTITPISIDTTDYKYLKHLKLWKL